MTHEHKIYDSDIHFVINPSTREFGEFDLSKKLIIQNDHNSERFTFELPRFVEGHDMSLCNVIQIHYVNIDKKAVKTTNGVYEVDDLKVEEGDEEKIVFSWLLSNNATKHVGSLNFLVRFSCLDENGKVTYAWNTQICKGLSVGEGLYNGYAVIEAYADVLEQWRQELVSSGAVDLSAYYTKDEIDEKVNSLKEDNANLNSKVETLENGGVSEETITNAVNTYLDENPIEATDVNAKLYEQGIVEQLAGEYKKYPIQVEDYSWNHLVGTKRLAPLVENATLFTTGGATAHESNAVGFNSNWFLFQWVQNIKGTTVDTEDSLGSCEIQGKLNYWRFGIAYNKNGESETFTIAKQGDSIKRTVSGDTITASGGVGICNVANKDSKTVYSIATYYHNGKHIPTTREIAIDSTDYTTTYDGKLTIGEATMWTITKDGVTSDYDDSILGTEYGGHPNCQIYCDYNSSGYNYYMAVVRPNKGVSMITSTDCTNWTWLGDIDIPCENTAYIETALCNFINTTSPRWYVAVRCKDGRLWVAKLLDDYSINWHFFINDCGSKPVFIRWHKSLLLATAPQSRYSCRLYRFTSDTKDLNQSYYPNRLEAVGDITYNACNYPFFCGNEGYPNYVKGTGETPFLCLGTNNFVTNKQGCSYFIDYLFKNLKYPNEAVNSLNVTYELPIATSEVLGGVMPIAKTTSMTQEVGVDENGLLYTKSSSGGSSTSWETVANETLEAEATAFTTVSFETARNISRIKAYVEVVGTATNGEEYSMDIALNGTVVMRSQKCVTKTDGTKKYAYFDIDLTTIGSFAKGYVQTANGDTWNSATCNQFGETIKSTTDISTILVRPKLGWGTLGVGSKLLLAVC